MTSVTEILNNKALFNQIVKQTFDAVDRDGSTFISKDELTIILTSICGDVGLDKPNEKEVSDILVMIDEDKSGLISFDEFRRLFKKLMIIINEY